jgi:neutral ceramidase
MARSHIAVALGAALIASLIVGQLFLNWRVPSVDFWHASLGQGHDGAEPWHFYGENELADDPSSYLIGVGKADITG